MAEGSARRRALREQLARLEPDLRVLAEEILGLDAVVDLVATDASGRLVIVLVAEPGRELEAVANALAQAAFLTPRVRDWKKLAPELPLRVGAGTRVLLVGASFGSRVRAAARAAGRIELLRRLPPGEPARQQRPRRPAAGSRTQRPSRFRTGLSDADLGPPKLRAPIGAAS